MTNPSIPRRYGRNKGRRSGGTFSALPHHITDSDEYARLKPREVKLLIDLLAQYRGPGKNNGDLSIAMNESPTARGMRRRGWRSSANLMKAAQGLLESGFVIQTRLGGRHLASLYALTWLQIDPCDGKLELAQIPRAPLNLWKDENRALRAAYQLVEKTPRRNFAAPPVERIAPRVVQ